MTSAIELGAPISHPDRLFIGGEWVKPSSDSMIDVIDCSTEELYFRVSEAQVADAERAIAAAREAFDNGPWPGLTHAQRAEYLRALSAELRTRVADLSQLWPRQAGVLHSLATMFVPGSADNLDYYADLADVYPFEEVHVASDGGFGLLVREPVGVVAAIIPWNGPLDLMCNKLAPALLAGCTAIVKASPEAPGEAYVLAEVAEAVGLPKGVLNVITADRAVSEVLVRDPRVDKISFTGSTAAGRRIASLLGERIGRYTLELGGKSAAVVLDDADISRVAPILAAAECFNTGQNCCSLTRIVVGRDRHDELVEALAAAFSQVRVGSPFDPEVQMGPLAMSRQRDRVEMLIAKGIEEGAQLVTGGGRPKDLDRGYYIEPTVFGNVDNDSTIAREEIFGPVLSVIAADDEADAIRIANDTIFGLNASVFTEDTDRALRVARAIRSGTVGHNGFRIDIRMAFGGYKQSGVGREGGKEGLLPYLETKTIILDDAPSGYSRAAEVTQGSHLNLMKGQ